MKTIKDFNIKDQKVLIRVDFNVPLKDGVIQDDARIVKAIPTIEYALEQGAKVILMSHLGRPKGERNLEFSLKPVADHLSSLLNKPVEFLNDCIGKEVEEKVDSIEVGQVFLLENLRFHKEETQNEDSFAEALSNLGDVYIDDAFGACHRAHASVEGVTHYLPSAAGFLLSKEVEYFGKALSEPNRPFVTILGGAKVSDKIKLIDNLVNKVDVLLIGGGMSYTFQKALGFSIGDSLLDEAGIEIAKQAIEKAKEKNVQLLLPEDYHVSTEFNETSDSKVTETPAIEDGWGGMDIGPKTVEKFKEVLKDAKTIVWNGPVGVFEMDKYQVGSQAIADFIGALEATSIIGGGDTASAIKKFNLEDKMSHISTGGGASLELLEGKELPGIQAILNQSSNAQV